MLAAVRVLEIVIISYFVLYNTINLFLLLVAWIQVRFFLRLKVLGSLESLYNSSSTPAVTIVVPAYNEQETIVESVRALMNLYYTLRNRHRQRRVERRHRKGAQGRLRFHPSKTRVRIGGSHLPHSGYLRSGTHRRRDASRPPGQGKRR